MSNTITPTVSIAPLTWRGWKSSIAKPVLPKCRLWSAKIRFDFQRNVTLLHCVEILGITGEITIRQRQALARSNFPGPLRNHSDPRAASHDWSGGFTAVPNRSGKECIELHSVL